MPISGFFLDALKASEIGGEAANLERFWAAADGHQEIVDIKEVVKDDRTERTTIIKQTLPQWQASAWLLERRHPDRYGKYIKPDPSDDEKPLAGIWDSLE